MCQLYYTNYFTFCKLNVKLCNWSEKHCNASNHCGYHVKQFLEDNLIETMDFPYYSSDLNPFEKYGIML